MADLSVADEPTHYEDRLARAKQANQADSPTGPRKAGFSGNLSSLENSLPVAGVTEDYDVDATTQLTTPRAATEVAISQQGEARHRHNELFRLGPEVLGAGQFKFAWRPGGKGANPNPTMIATGSTKRGVLVVQIFRRDGSVHSQHTLGHGKCLWIGWDCTGVTLAFHQADRGIFIWEVSDAGSEEQSVPLALAPAFTVDASFCQWSKVGPQLAIGTVAGKVIVYNNRQVNCQVFYHHASLKLRLSCRHVHSTLDVDIVPNGPAEWHQVGWPRASVYARGRLCTVGIGGGRGAVINHNTSTITLTSIHPRNPLLVIVIVIVLIDRNRRFLYHRDTNPHTLTRILSPTPPPPIRWPIQDIISLVCVYARIHYPFIAPAHSHYPHYCNTIARLLRHIYPPPRPSLVMPYTIQYW